MSSGFGLSSPPGIRAPPIVFSTRLSAPTARSATFPNGEGRSAAGSANSSSLSAAGPTSSAIRSPPVAGRSLLSGFGTGGRAARKGTRSPSTARWTKPASSPPRPPDDVAQAPHRPGQPTDPPPPCGGGRLALKARAGEGEAGDRRGIGGRFRPRRSRFPNGRARRAKPRMSWTTDGGRCGARGLNPAARAAAPSRRSSRRPWMRPRRRPRPPRTAPRGALRSRARASPRGARPARARAGS